MTSKYPEAEQTFEALKILGAENKFVSFNDIFKKVKFIRASRNLKTDTKNLKGRVRRSLVYNEKTILINSSEQCRELNIALKFKPFKVISLKPIILNEKGLIKNSKEVEENSFKLIK
jgi:hypothetical protein